MSNLNSTVRMQAPDAKNIPCKDCIFRDMTTVTVNGHTIPTGVTKKFCLVFNKEETTGKPSEILFGNAPCPAYKGEP